MIYEVWSEQGFEGTSPREAEADHAANEISRRHGQAEVRDASGKVVARHWNGQRVIRKVRGFESASARPALITVPFTPRPARRIGFGLAA